MRPLRLVMLATAAVPAVLAAQPSRVVPLADLHHTAWGTREGVPASGVQRIVRSGDGYLWFGAIGAILRFDGVRFTRFDSANTPALRGPASYVRPYFVDRDGAMWIGRGDGAIVTYRDGEFVLRIPPDTSRRGLGRGSTDRAGRHWFIATGPRVVTETNGQLVAPRFPPDVPDAGVNAVIPDTGSGIWVGTLSAGLWHVTASATERFAQDPSGPGIRPILQSRDGTLWAYRMGLSALRNGRWTLVGESPAHPGRGVRPSDGTEGPDGAVWFATNEGVLRVQDGQLEWFTEREGLSSNEVGDVFVDPHADVWVTTKVGIDRLRVTPFKTFAGPPVPSQFVTPDARRGLWVASWTDARLFHVDGGPIRGGPGALTWTEPAASLKKRVAPLAGGRGGGLWFTGRDSAQLFRYRDGVVERVPLSLPAAQLRLAVEHPDGSLWLAGLPFFFGRLRGHEFTKIFTGFTESEPAQATPFDLIEDERGHVWFSRSVPFLVVEIADGRVIHRYGAESGIRTGVMALAAEPGGTVWGSTLDGRLIRIKAGTVHQIRLAPLEPLLREVNNGLVAHGGHLWIVGNAGIARLSFAELNRVADGLQSRLRIRAFDESDGLLAPTTSQFGRAPFSAAADGRLWVATAVGLAVFDPTRDHPTTDAPIPLIEELAADARPVDVRARASVSPNPGRVEIRYTATNLPTPDRATIEYKLDGADRDWSRGDPRRVAAYMHLGPGTYTFRVRARNEDGVASTADATLAFRVAPAWYQAWWFAALVVVAIAASGAGGAYAHQQTTARRHASELRAGYAAALAERARVARELHDTLLQGFTGIALQLHVLERTAGASNPATRPIERLATIADETLRDARRMVWDMGTPELDAHDLPRAIEQAAEHLVGTAAVQLAFESTGVSRALPANVEIALFRIAREGVSNAVRHAEATRITITLTYEPTGVRLTIRDDGRGFAPERAALAAADGHMGLRGMRERAREIHASADILSETARGTTVTVSVPVSSTAAPTPFS